MLKKNFSIITKVPLKVYPFRARSILVFAMTVYDKDRRKKKLVMVFVMHLQQFFPFFQVKIRFSFVRENVQCNECKTIIKNSRRLSRCVLWLMNVGNVDANGGRKS